MKYKRSITFLMCLILCLSFVPTIVLAANRDVSKEELLATDLKTLSLFKGVSETDFDLDRAPTRVEALVMLIRVLGKESEALNGSWKHPFNDVPSWANKYVGYAYQSGLTNGISSTQFGTGNANAAMYLTFVLRSLGYSDNGGADFTWNNPYNLAKKIGILPARVNTTTFWRADVVSVSYAALQVPLKGTEQTLAQKLISMGVFTQALFDSCYKQNVFSSEQNTTQLPTGEKLTAEQISEKCSNAVFYIDIYALNGEIAGSGSGFFISSDGLAVTNFHVASNSSALYVTTADGTVYKDVKIIDCDLSNDLALLKVNGGPFPHLSMGDSDTIKQGQTVYAIGSPIGLQNTLSQGLISNPKRVLDGVEYCQISAQIYSGSSGGALINEYGQVVGVTSAGFINTGADLNLAIPINKVKALDTSLTTPLFIWNDTMYNGFEDVLDFGAFTGVDLMETYYTSLGYHLVYDIWDFHDGASFTAADNYAYSMYNYIDALNNQGFSVIKDEENLKCYSTDTEVVYIEIRFNEGAIHIWVEDRVVYYDEFKELPDFGWYADIEQYEEPYAIDNSLMYTYRCTGSGYTREEFKTMLEWYCWLLEDYDYVCRYSDNTSWLYEGNGLSVVLILEENETYFYIDVAKLK